MQETTPDDYARRLRPDTARGGDGGRRQPGARPCWIGGWRAGRREHEADHVHADAERRATNARKRRRKDLDEAAERPVLTPEPTRPIIRLGGGPGSHPPISADSPFRTTILHIFRTPERPPPCSEA